MLGQTAAHEAVHLYGAFHTDATNTVTTLMDGGAGQDLATVFGVGPDGVGGTDDDVPARLGQDAYDPNEAFTGVQDTLNVAAFGLSRGRR